MPPKFCVVAYLYDDWPEPAPDLTKPFEFDLEVYDSSALSPGCRVCRLAKHLGRIQRDILAEPNRFVIVVDHEESRLQRGSTLQRRAMGWLEEMIFDVGNGEPR